MRGIFARSQARRPALFWLAAGLLLWTAATGVLHGSGQAPTAIPSPADWLFLPAYAALVTYLLVDLAPSDRARLNIWLEALVFAAGLFTVVGGLLVMPLADDLGREGLALVMTLRYPLLDVGLVAVVAGQIVLRKRAASTKSAVLTIGFGLLLGAHTDMVLDLAVGHYRHPVLLHLGWLAALVTIVLGALRPPVVWADTRLTRLLGGYGVVGLAWIAVGFLAVRPAGEPRIYVVMPAVLTLATAGACLVFTIRQAHGAAEAFRLSRTDDLTGLPNRRAVIAKLHEELSTERTIGVMLLDLDGFKEVNDSLGHAAGDVMLRTIATRIRFAMPAKVLVARLGGDEFAVVLDETDPVRLVEYAQMVRDVVRKPVRLDGLELAITGSVGITTRVQGDTCPGDFLHRADLAMYRAKQGRHGVLTYDAEHDEVSAERLRVAADLQAGISSGQLEVWYQPQVSALGAEVCGVEALVRWRHPEDGLISPGIFLPIARRAGLMSDLSEAVVRQVVADARDWQAAGHLFPVAINVAPAELLSGPVLGRLFDEVTSAGLTPESIIVEVTEDSFIAEPARAREVIQDIRRHGLQVSIDDYGTGFSSLAYLRELPIQELKIDRSFVAALLEDPRSHMIITTTNQMAHGLGLRTVAEGVEDEETAQELVALGFDVLQGYLFARPMPAAKLTDWLAQRAAHSTLV